MNNFSCRCCCWNATHFVAIFTSGHAPSHSPFPHQLNLPANLIDQRETSHWFPHPAPSKCRPFAPHLLLAANLRLQLAASVPCLQLCLRRRCQPRRRHVVVVVVIIVIASCDSHRIAAQVKPRAVCVACLLCVYWFVAPKFIVVFIPCNWAKLKAGMLKCL